MSKLSWYFHRVLSVAVRDENRAAQIHWGTQREYNQRPDNVDAIARSLLVAKWVMSLNANKKPVVELGCNTARNLAFIDVQYGAETPKLIGVDVNKDALDRATKRNMRDFTPVRSAAEKFVETSAAIGVVITMSAIDHMADGEFSTLLKWLPARADALVMVELFTGKDETVGPFKYSRDLRTAFEGVGFETLCWELMPVGQYDLKRSPLYLYVGKHQDRE